MDLKRQGGSSKKALAEERKAAAKAEKDEKKRLEKDMKKILSLSHKVITLVKPLGNRMEKFEKGTMAKFSGLSDDMKNTFEKKKAETDTWITQATEVLKRTASNKEYDWSDCSFIGDKEITLHMKDCNKIMKEISTSKKAAATAAK